MLKADVIWPATFRYKTNSEWEPIGFFLEALCNATTFDLMLGFFSSAAINILSCGFASFIYRGGKMRMIINDILNSDDVGAIKTANDGNDLPYFDVRDLENLSYSLNKRDRHFFDCLAWLIRNDRIEIKIIRMKNGCGISHTKCGTFSDGKNKIAFEGSVNFSLSALVHNKESLGISCDWNGSADVSRIEDIQNSFNKTFDGYDEDVQFVDVSDLKGYVINNYPTKGLGELLKDELELLESESLSSYRNSIKSVIKKAQIKIKNDLTNIENNRIKELEPHFPFPEGPRDYQKEAFDKWKENDQRGFFAMATGTGKTITALNCLLEIYKKLGYYKAIIVVPTKSLVEQWDKECKKFGFNNVIKIYSQSSTWRNDISNIEMMENINITKSPVNYVLIVTYSSFAKPAVYSKLFNLPKNKVLFLADEAHNMGSPQLLKLMPKIPYLRRIGLSATPKRQFDEKGNRSIANFFGFEGENYTYSYTMSEAIKNNILCRYYYYPHVVALTDQEFSEYLILSNKIAKYLMINGEDFKNDPMLTALLIKRKRIIHKAINKQNKFKQILEDYYNSKQSLKYTLVYVPEGNSNDIDDELIDDLEQDNDTIHLIDLYTSIVRDINPTVTVMQFTSDSKNRDDLLATFAMGKLDVLTSMKCLDEGVDVPRSELAIFCASTGNPRQFIQRRGRILRTHKDKEYAVIHDLVVAPLINSNSEAFLVERNLLRSELKRVKDFSELSENPSATLMELTPVLNHYNLNLYEDNE